MIYIIVLSFFVLSLLTINIIYSIDLKIDKKVSNNILILLPNMIIPILIYTKYDMNVQTLSYIMLVPFLTLISIIDFRTSYVYDITILSGIIMQCIIFLPCLLNYDRYINLNWVNNFRGLLVGVVLSYIVAKTTKSMGEGDIGFYGLCSFVIGGEYTLYMMMLSFVLASIYGVCILISKKASLKSTIPFTPFISLATILIMLTEWDMINFYFDILGNYL